jgi:two-component system chemotaxis response regulator CheY
VVKPNASYDDPRNVNVLVGKVQHGGSVTRFREEPQVLIIDDVLATRLLIRDMLAEMGISRTVDSADGIEALDVLHRVGAQLIICDLFMDDMHGGSLLSVVKRDVRLRNIPVLMMSATADAYMIKAALEMGAWDFLVKPLAFRDFRNRVLKVLRTRTADKTVLSSS